MKKVILAFGAFVLFSVTAQAQSLTQDEQAAKTMDKKIVKKERVVEKKAEATGVEKKAARVLSQDEAAELKKTKAKVKAKAKKVDN